MTQQTVGHSAGLRQRLRPARPPDAPSSWWRVSWSVPAAVRALRATLVVPAVLAVTFKVIGDPQMTIFAVFGAFGALVMASFAGTRRDKVISHFGLAVAGSVVLILGTLASTSDVTAVLVTVPVAFAIYFSGMIGPNAAAGVTPALLAYVLAVASAGGTSTILSRVEGWWLASAVSTIAVLLISPPSPGDRLRQSAAALARALARYLQAAVNGSVTAADQEAMLGAKHSLMTLFDSTPYRPTGLATADQGLASLVSLLEWSASLASETLDGHLNVRDADPADRDLIADSATELDAIAELLDGRQADVSLERLWRARSVSAAHLRALTGDPDTVRRVADQAFHAQAIGISASAAAGNALIATRRLDPDAVEALRRRLVAAVVPEPGAPLAAGGDGSDRAAGDDAGGRRRRYWRMPGSGLIVADASVRSVWFRNSARGGIAIAAAVAVAKITGVQHAFWVVLGTLSVLRTSAGATGATAMRALAGTVVGFVIGAALVVGIGVSPAALWVALPLAVLVAAYTPGTAPFLAGQAAFTVVVVVLFNLLVPAGWKVGLVRVEDVAIGCAVSIVVGVLFWPRGASALVGDNLADALSSGAAYLKQAADWALGLPERYPRGADDAVAAGIRLDDALRALLTEQGSKRIDKQDLWTLSMSALRLRLTAESLAGLPGLSAARSPEAGHPLGSAVQAALAREAAEIAGFYDQIALEVARPGHPAAPPPAVTLPAAATDMQPAMCTIGSPHYHPVALWVRAHLTELASHSAALVGPAKRLAEVRRTPWWLGPRRARQDGN